MQFISYVAAERTVELFKICPDELNWKSPPSVVVVPATDAVVPAINVSSVVP